MYVFSYMVFAAVVEQKSFVGAAQSMHLTPSAVSHSIAKLEQTVGVSLFDRDRNGAKLTAYGEKILPFIYSIVNDQKRLNAEIETIQQAIKEAKTKEESA